MKILINALGIQDSGGIKVLKKFLDECSLNHENSYLIICNTNPNIDMLIEKYTNNKKFLFHPIKSKGFLHRLYYENFKFNTIINKESIKLVYNFSGTTQLFLNVPQLLKIHNLLFYSKKLDQLYINSGNFSLWVKQIYLKRIVFKYMANKASYIEIQSFHVKEYMSDFIDSEKKTFFLKSDIAVKEKEFLEPKEYDFSKKVKFLYIVGPHFEYMHKNFIEFTDTMVKLSKLKVDFEINVTLTKEQLEKSLLWNSALNKRTNFLGYLSDEKEMDKLFCDNTILISTSVIETIGLHVIEAIKKGVLTIVPNEKYSSSVYGKRVIRYELFDSKSLLNSILSIINDKKDYKNHILQLQEDLKKSENNKYNNIIDIFKKVAYVQK